MMTFDMAPAPTGAAGAARSAVDAISAADPDLGSAAAAVGVGAATSARRC
jgi:hypothetical protein